jgi:hypothetical protein
MKGAGIILKRIAQGKNHCKKCGWDGDRVELVPTDLNDPIGHPVCPKCKKPKVVSSETLARDFLSWHGYRYLSGKIKKTRKGAIS